MAKASAFEPEGDDPPVPTTTSPTPTPTDGAEDEDVGGLNLLVHGRPIVAVQPCSVMSGRTPNAMSWSTALMISVEMPFAA